jgi:dTDP-4-dehydrorhamnose 3,5-epimerase
MRVRHTKLPGVIIIEFDRYADSRGSFFESWHREKYSKLGIGRDFVQDNLSTSTKGVLRGLHFQNPHSQGKLVQVLVGEVFDVAVDVRIGSPTFKQWVGLNLSASSDTQLYIPEGFAHGFVVLSDSATFMYKCTDIYMRDCEKTIRWDDSEIEIAWPIPNPILSERDRLGVRLSEIPHTDLPKA